MAVTINVNKIKFRDQNGNYQAPVALQGDTGAQGPKGDQGDDYTLTQQDRTEIAGIVETDLAPVIANAENATDAANTAAQNANNAASSLFENVTEVTDYDDTKTYKNGDYTVQDDEIMRYDTSGEIPFWVSADFNIGDIIAYQSALYFCRDIIDEEADTNEETLNPVVVSMDELYFPPYIFTPATVDEMVKSVAKEEVAPAIASANTAAQNANNATGYIAVTEATSTASAAHAQGSYLIYDGKLYQATANIAIGDTLAATGSGANIAQAPGGAMGEVADLKSAINPLYAVITPQIIANSYWPYEGSSAGIPSYYSGWSRTDRLPCVEGETLKITATVASAYNVFFNTDTDGDVNGHFNIAVGENSILVPQGAHYYALSNTTSGMNNTTIKKIIDGTTVNNGIDSIVEIDNAVNGIKTPISYQSPTSGGYYRAVVGEAISVISGNGSYFSQIDLSSYAGKKVRISFASTGTTSTRATAICDSNGIVGAFVEEKTIISKGYAEFDVGLTYNRLYISYNASAYNLTITVIDAGIIYAIEEIHMQCVYVSENGNDSNNGSITAPFATLQKAVDSGALIIKVEAGEYKAVTIKDRLAPLKIMLKNMPNEYSAQTPEAPKIKITTDGTSDYYGVCAVNCNDIYLSDIWVDGTAYDSYYLTNVGKLECVRCWCCDTTDSNSMGFRIVNCNGVFRDCKAWNVSKDGFNIHIYGDTQFINCVAHDCGDDGISHHEGCNGMIIGGEYYNCAKGGIASPYGGCNVNIYNAYMHNNRFGLYSQSGAEHNKSKGILANCVIKNNNEYDLNIAKSDIVGWGNIYDTKTIDSSATFTEF